MSALERLRGAVLAAFDDAVALAGTDLTGAQRAKLGTGRDRLERGQYHVVACGEFRRGKSSLLNALVGRPRMFPVDVDVTTAVVTTLQWGPQDRAEVVFAEEDPQRPGGSRSVEIPLADVATYVTEQANPRNEKRVSRIAMAAPIEQLRSGLVLVDTPGVGSVNPAHTAATRAFLPSADAILFVGSAVEPLSTVELDFLALALRRSRIVITAITMIDKVVDPDAVAAEARKRVAVASGVDADRLTVVPVSALRKREAVEDDDPELLAESGFPALDAAIWDGLAVACGWAQLADALALLDAAVVQASAPVANERAALRDGAALERIDEELKAARERANGLRAEGARWRADLQDDLDRAARPVRERMSVAFDGVRSGFARQLRSERVTADPDALVQEVVVALVEAANEATSELGRAATEIAERYSLLTSTTVTAAVVPAGGDGIAPVRKPEGGAVELVTPERREGAGFAKFRQQYGGFTASAAAGALIGTLILPAVGSVVGGLIGGIIGWVAGGNQANRDAAERAQRERAGELREQALPMINSIQNRARDNLAELQRDYVRALTRSLEEQISGEVESLTASIGRLAEARRRAATDRAQRLRELDAAAQRYRSARDRLAALQAQVTQQANETPEATRP